MGNLIEQWILDQNFAFISVSALAFVLLFAYGFTAGKLERLQNKINKSQGQKQKDAEEEADKIVKDALQRAREITAYAEKFTSEQNAKLATMAEKTLKKNVEEMTAEVRRTLDDEISGFGDNLAAELKAARQGFETQLDRHRQQIIADMEKEADQKLKQIVEDVLGGGISRQVQERLLREALSGVKASLESKDGKTN